jgi:hypothetical protein
MPYFRVILHGTGVLFDDVGDGSSPCIGFYTGRGLRASCAEEAVLKAKKSVLELWATAEYRSANKGRMPDLKTHLVERASFWEARKIPKRGHIFYTEE